MDLRTKRTKQNIINAFMELRQKKPLEKITVKELSELALINKATFYSHYNDIYDLSDQLEKETIDMILAELPHPEELVSNPKRSTEELTSVLYSHLKIIDVIFSGNRTAILADKLEQRIKNRVYTIHPEYQNNLEWDILLTIITHGCFHAFASHSNNTDTKRLIGIIGNMNEKIITACAPT